MEDLSLGIRLLVLLAVANSAPIAAKRLLGDRWAVPLDGGLRWFDGRPLLGASKTVRGVVVAAAACMICAPVEDIPVGAGALIGLGAMAGDALSSFVKRRLAIETSGRAPALDQIPESLLPLLAVQGVLDLSVLQIVLVTAAFALLEVPIARLAHRLGLRERPY